MTNQDITNTSSFEELGSDADYNTILHYLNSVADVPYFNMSVVLEYYQDKSKFITMFALEDARVATYS